MRKAARRARAQAPGGRVRRNQQRVGEADAHQAYQDARQARRAAKAADRQSRRKPPEHSPVPPVIRYEVTALCLQCGAGQGFVGGDLAVLSAEASKWVADHREQTGGEAGGHLAQIGAAMLTRSPEEPAPPPP